MYILHKGTGLTSDRHTGGQIGVSECIIFLIATSNRTTWHNLYRYISLLIIQVYACNTSFKLVGHLIKFNILTSKAGVLNICVKSIQLTTNTTYFS